MILQAGLVLGALEVLDSGCSRLGLQNPKPTSSEPPFNTTSPSTLKCQLANSKKTTGGLESLSCCMMRKVAVSIPGTHGACPNHALNSCFSRNPKPNPRILRPWSVDVNRFEIRSSSNCSSRRDLISQWCECLRLCCFICMVCVYIYTYTYVCMCTCVCWYTSVWVWHIHIIHIHTRFTMYCSDPSRTFSLSMAFPLRERSALFGTCNKRGAACSALRNIQNPKPQTPKH